MHIVSDTGAGRYNTERATDGSSTGLEHDDEKLHVHMMAQAGEMQSYIDAKLCVSYRKYSQIDEQNFEFWLQRTSGG